MKKNLIIFFAALVLIFAVVLLALGVRSCVTENGLLDIDDGKYDDSSAMEWETT